MACVCLGGAQIAHIASLGIGATEADNGEAQLDTAYRKNPAAFKGESAKYRMILTRVYQELRLHETARLPEMRNKIAHVAKASNCHPCCHRAYLGERIHCRVTRASPMQT